MSASIHHVRSRDGTRIAYTIDGHGPPLVYLQSATFSHTQLYRHLPGAGAFLEKLAGSRQLISIDLRGTGMSEREYMDHSPEAGTDDVETVVNELGLHSIDIIAICERVTQALRFADRCPEVVRRIMLVLPVGPAPIAATDPGAPGILGITRSNWELFLQLMAQRLTGQPVRDSDQVFRYRMRCADQRNMVAELEASRPTEDWELARTTRCPVLVVYRDHSIATEGATQELASQFPTGQIVYLPEDANPMGSRPDLLLQAIDEFFGPPEMESKTDSQVSLTRRELEVLRLLAAGQTEPEIGASLCISRATVSRHVMSIYTKLGMHRKAEAVAWAVRHGIE